MASKPSKKKRPASKEKLRRFLLANIGTILESSKLQAVAGGAKAIQYSRRLRELREQEGWPILSHNDTTDLKPGQYLLKHAPPVGLKIAPGISARLRAVVLDRNGFTCQMCGLTPGEIDPATGRKVRLHIGHIKDKTLGGKDEASNLRTLCSTCNQGAKNVTTEKPSTIWLKSQVRRAGIDEQRAVYGWLKTKFEK